MARSAADPRALSRDRGGGGVVTASTGNHGAATAWAARRLGLSATVFVPVGASRAKIALIESLGARDPGGGRRLRPARRRRRPPSPAQRGLPFFEDGNEPAQYEGYGAIAVEILEQMRAAAGAVVRAASATAR